MSRKPRIAIIGGGIGGLTAAAALYQRDVEIEVFEQSAKIGEIGAGVALTPNAMKAYRALGLEAQITEVGYESDYQELRVWNTGAVFSRVPRKGAYTKEFGASYLTMHRAEIDQATGMLTEQLGVGIEEAFVRLRAYAYAQDRRLADVARDLVARKLRMEPDPNPRRDGVT